MVLIEEIEVEAEAEDIQDTTQDISIIHLEDRAHIVRDHMITSIVVSTIQLKRDEIDWWSWTDVGHVWSIAHDTSPDVLQRLYASTIIQQKKSISGTCVMDKERHIQGANLHKLVPKVQQEDQHD